MFPPFSITSHFANTRTRSWRIKTQNVDVGVHDYIVYGAERPPKIKRSLARNRQYCHSNSVCSVRVGSYVITILGNSVDILVVLLLLLLFRLLFILATILKVKRIKAKKL